MRRPLYLGSVLLALLAVPVSAHHILGIPHYAYDEQYPQTPILTYKVDAGAYQVLMTGYPGIPKPGERCDLHVDLRRIDSGEAFPGKVSLTVFEDNLFGEDPIVYGPVESEAELAIFRFHPRFVNEANYLIRIEYEAENAPWMLDLPMVVGTPGSPWTVLGGVFGGMLLFIVIVRAMRIKMARRKAKQSKAEQSRAEQSKAKQSNAGAQTAEAH